MRAGLVPAFLRVVAVLAPLAGRHRFASVEWMLMGVTSVTFGVTAYPVLVTVTEVTIRGLFEETIPLRASYRESLPR